MLMVWKLVQRYLTGKVGEGRTRIDFLHVQVTETRDLVEEAQMTGTVYGHVKIVRNAYPLTVIR